MDIWVGKEIEGRATRNERDGYRGEGREWGRATGNERDGYRGERGRATGNERGKRVKTASIQNA